MSDGKDLALVVPVYNEGSQIARTIGAWVEKLRALRVSFDIHVYNDGSTDDTRKLLEDLQVEYLELKVHNKENSGHGPTILLGYRDQSRNSPWLFQVDSDGEIGPEDFSSLWDVRDDYDFLTGVRQGRRQKLSRRIMSWAAAEVVFLVFGERVADPNCPYRLMRSSAFSDLYWMIPEGTFAPNVVVSGFAAQRGLRILEVPVETVEKKPSVSQFDKNLLLMVKTALISFSQTVALGYKLRSSR